MSESRPVELIGLWILVEGRWQPFENFDPSSPQFKRAHAPADYAFFEASRQGKRLVRDNRSIMGYRVRREGRERGR